MSENTEELSDLLEALEVGTITGTFGKLTAMWDVLETLAEELRGLDTSEASEAGLAAIHTAENHLEGAYDAIEQAIADLQ